MNYPESHRSGESKKSLSGIFKPDQWRILILGGIIVIIFFIMIIRLAYVQIKSADQSIETISRQSLRRIRIPAKRGKIYTRDLLLLAGNSSDLNLVFYPQEMRQKGGQRKTVKYIFDVAETISKAIGKPNPLTERDITVHLNFQPGLPLTLFRQLSVRELERALESARKFPGVDIAPDESRTYPEGILAAHIVGYTRNEDAQNASDRRDYSYYIPDRIGVQGVERVFDRLPGVLPSQADYTPQSGTLATPLGLRGMPGYSLFQVDHLGLIRRKIISRIEPHHGNNVILAIDSRAQKIAESLIAGQRGAMVILDASNGDVVASASAPSYNLSAGFSTIIRKDYYKKLLNSPSRPLYNRAFLGNYTPGSILKPLVALAFLNSGISPDETVNCDGAAIVNGVRIRCAARYGHGMVNLHSALEKSCNDYMIENSQAVGFEPIADVLHSAGIGQKTGVELPEISGTFPGNVSKRRSDPNAVRWNSYDTALLSIGQGIITLSPLQAAVYAAAIANGGKIYKPHVVWKVVDANGNALYERTIEKVGELVAIPDALEAVHSGMYAVVNSSGGSGKEARVEGLEIHGKTGSAEVGSGANRFLTTWFIAFVTYREKTYSCCIMIEEGRSGGKSCAPLAAEFFRRFLLEQG
ncbi:MAG: hypothetical protein LBM70_04865 [Victivallales bacterium]|nr:hypothetical protein [Victivallales bacterium]